MRMLPFSLLILHGEPKLCAKTETDFKDALIVLTYNGVAFKEVISY
jgi:hypothetical protein